MKTVFIRFEMPENKSGKNKNLIKSLSVKILSLVIPLANPDFENQIEEVKYWLVECDGLSGIPLREVGLNKEDVAVMKMPFNDNCGYWTDNNLLLNDFKIHFQTIEILKETFEQYWMGFGQ